MLFALTPLSSLKDNQLPRLLKNLRDLEDVLAKRIDQLNIADGSLITALFADGSVTQVKAAANAFDGTIAKNVASGDVVAGMKLVYVIAVPAGATANIDTVLTHKVRVIDAHLVKRSAAGGGAGTIQLFNGATAITDAMSINVADRTVVAAGTIDDAAWEIAAGGTLRIVRTRTASTDETCDVFVECVRVA